MEAIVDKSDVIDRAKSTQRVGIELLLKDLLLSNPSLKTIIPDSPTLAS